MGRSGYSDGCDNDWSLICYRGAVKSAIRGKRGQAFLREMLAAMDALPEKRLISGDLVFEGHPEFPYPHPEEDIIVGGDQLVTGGGVPVRIGEVCAIGSVGLARGVDMSKLDPEDPETVADTFGIATAMAREIVYENDESVYYAETPEQRFTRMRAWIVGNLKGDIDASH